MPKSKLTVGSVELPPSLPPSLLRCLAYLAHQAVQGRMGGGARRAQLHGRLFRKGDGEGGMGGVREEMRLRREAELVVRMV